MKVDKNIIFRMVKMTGGRLTKLYSTMIDRGIVSNKREFAELLNIKYGNLSKYMTDQVNLSVDNRNFNNLHSANINIQWLLTGEGAMFISEETMPAVRNEAIPILSQKVSCGSGVNWENEQNIVEYLDIQNLVPALKNRQLYGFRVSGTSMIGAGIKNNDIVIFSSEQNYVYNDGVYVFSLDGDVYCKRLEFDPIANRIKIYSVRVADIEKAELLTTLTSTDTTFTERFQLFGKVEFWIHKGED